MFKRLVKLFISISFFIFDYMRKLIKRLFGKIDSGTCVVLLYHVVAPEMRKNFAKQIDSLTKLAKPISIEKRGNLEPETHHVVITFDDGFYSFVENALPELTKRNIPVIIFVPAGRLGQKPDWLSIKYSHLINEIVMTPDQLKQLAENNLVTIGSHGLTHKNFMCLEEQGVIKELSESKHILESILQRDIELLSFPFGSYTQKHLELARSASYRYAFGILPTMAFCNSDEYVAGRVDVDPNDWSLEFQLKTIGAYRWLSTADRTTQGRAGLA